MHALIIAPKYNSPPTKKFPPHCTATGEPRKKGQEPTHRCDASGAFQSGATQFRRIHNIAEPVIMFDNTTNKKRRLKQLADRMIGDADIPSKAYDVVAYFGHGWTDRLSSLQLGNLDITQFGILLALTCKNNVTVIFYACWSGVPGGPAERLATSLLDRCGLTPTIYAHTTEGHAYHNPYNVRYPGGDYIIAPKSPLWRAWCNALSMTDLWARYPFMTKDELEKTLLCGASGAAIGTAMGAAIGGFGNPGTVISSSTLQGGLPHLSTP